MVLKLDSYPPSPRFSTAKSSSTIVHSNGAVASILFLAFIAALTTSCGVSTPANASPGPSQNSPVIPVSSIAIFPSGATLAAGQTVQFAASVNNASSAAVTWSANAGSVSDDGLFTAPSVASEEYAMVTATSTADPTKTAVHSLGNPPRFNLAILEYGEPLLQSRKCSPLPR